MKKLVLILPLLQGCQAVAFFYPPMHTYIQEEKGKADLAEATYNRQIKTREAEAKLESSVLEAKAEVERAKGVAEANRIIGESLKQNESYLRYLWIQNLNTGGNETIYIPTEAGLPILESGRFVKPELRNP